MLKIFCVWGPSWPYDPRTFNILTFLTSFEHFLSARQKPFNRFKHFPGVKHFLIENALKWWYVKKLGVWIANTLFFPLSVSSLSLSLFFPLPLFSLSLSHFPSLSFLLHFSIPSLLSAHSLAHGTLPISLSLSFSFSFFILLLILCLSFSVSLSLSLFLCFSFSVSLSLSLFLCLSFSVSLSLSLFLCLSFSVFLLSVFLSLSFFLCLSFSVFLSPSFFLRLSFSFPRPNISLKARP